MKLIGDENFDNHLIRYSRQELPNIDLVRVQDVGLRQASDSLILEWAANNERILLTHDIKTMPDFGYFRVSEGLSMSGILVVPEAVFYNEVIQHLLLILGASEADEWRDKVTFLPLK